VERVQSVEKNLINQVFHPRARGTNALSLIKEELNSHSVRVRGKQVFALCSFCVFVCFLFISCFYRKRQSLKQIVKSQAGVEMLQREVKKKLK
jgi:hypothetical protein